MSRYEADAIIDPKPLKVSEFLKVSKYFVPKYQRKYEWGTNELEKLWLDIDAVFRSNVSTGKFKKDVSPHYLGAIVVKNQKKEGRYEIIDGQQRTITIMCLLTVVAEFSKNENSRDGDDTYNWIHPPVCQPANGQL